MITLPLLLYIYKYIYNNSGKVSFFKNYKNKKNTNNNPQENPEKQNLNRTAKRFDKLAPICYNNLSATKKNERMFDKRITPIHG